MPCIRQVLSTKVVCTSWPQTIQCNYKMLIFFPANLRIIVFGRKGFAVLLERDQDEKRITGFTEVAIQVSSMVGKVNFLSCTTLAAHCYMTRIHLGLQWSLQYGF